VDANSHQGTLGVAKLKTQSLLLAWPFAVMEVAVVLLCHEFHLATAQCGIMSHHFRGSSAVPLSEIDTVLVVAYRKEHYYALLEVVLATFTVTIWETLSHANPDDTVPPVEKSRCGSTTQDARPQTGY
jgi:hypothetical protein